MKLFVSVILVFKIFCCFGQSDIKLYKQKENILKTIKYKDTNLDSLLYYSKKVQNSDNDCDILSGLNSEAYYYYKIKDFDKSKNLALKTIQKIDVHLSNKKEEVCFIKTKLSLLNRLFWIYRNKGAYDNAYKQLIKTSLFLESIKDNDFDKFFYVINNELSKSQIKYELELEKDAKVILNNLVKKIETKKINFKNLFYKKAFFRKQADIYNSLGKTYITLSKTENNLTFLDSASICFEKAYNAALKFTPPHPDSKLNYQFRQTEVLISKKEYEKALGLINNYSYPKSNDSIATFSFQETAFYKSICYNNLKKSDSAIYYAKRAVRKSGLKKSQVITMYDILSNQFIQKNKLDSAYKYSQLTLKQFNLAKENKYKTYQLLYDNDIEKITELNNSIVEKEKKKNLTQLLFYSVLLLSVSTFFLLKRKKYKQEISEKIDELKTSTSVNKKDTEEKAKQTSRVNYNIENQLEAKILAKIQEIENSHDYLSQDFSINTISESLETNNTYVSYVFNKHFEISFKQYYTQKKIEYAVHLINNTEYYKKYSIEGLANNVGYTNASSFSRAFKKHMNVTPSEYIKNLSK